MKQNATNEFKDGLNLDLHPIVTPNTVLTDNLNGTFITYNGNEFCLQNDRGNKWVTNLTEGYTPIGIKEHNGVLYIVSVNGDKTEVGTFPSPIYPETWPNDDSSQEAIDLYEKNKTLDDENYRALHVLENHEPLTGMELGYDLQHPVTIEVQDSYDGSVNLILVDGEHKNRIINSGFSVLPNNQYKFVNRKQSVKTNIYNDLDKESELIRTSNVLTNIDLRGVQSGGQFKGGNYTFYIKFGDADYNQTDVVAESGIVSIFNGNDGVPSTISGTLLDERTDKMIHLEIQGLNHIYSKIYIYYSREYSDTQGFRMTEYGMFTEPIDLKESYIKNNLSCQDIWLTGFEQTSTIDSEILNVDYHTVDWARAETQHSNMLFLGNVGQKETFALYHRLNDITEQASLIWKQASIEDNNYLPAVSMDYRNGEEYYSTDNIYKKVGYYPGELYRFGIVYILKDGSKTPVFNIGNNDGVYLCPKLQDVITNDAIYPIYAEVTIPTITEDDVIGWFVVRQKRIPNTICEGLSIAIDTVSNTPMVWDGKNWVTQSFLSSKRESNDEIVQLEYNSSQKNIIIEENNKSFEEWFTDHNFKYDEAYWYYLNENTDVYYSVESTFDWDSWDNTHDKIINAIQNIVDRLNLERSYSVFTTTSSDMNVVDQNRLEEEQLNALQTSSVQLKWYQKYTLTSVDNSKIPTDSPTQEYAVGIILNLEEYNSIPVSSGNKNYYNALKRSYYSKNPNGSLQYKFIKNTLDEFEVKEANALLSLDPCVKQEVASKLDGSEYHVELERCINMNAFEDDDENKIYKNIFTTDIDNKESNSNIENCKCVFVKSDTNVKVVDGYEFSNIAGTATDVSKYKPFSTPFFIFDPQMSGNTLTGDELLLEVYDILKKQLASAISEDDKMQFLRSFYSTLYGSNKNINLLRGLFTPYIGLADNTEIPIGIYSIKLKPNVSSESDKLVRSQDKSEYYAISNYTDIDTKTLDVFRGDCYTNTVTLRIIRNFIDSTAPTTDLILDPDSWYNYVVIKNRESSGDGKVSYEDVNLSDVNAVDLGYWVTFKCLSSYNLGLRSIDKFHVDEMSLMGSPRSFYPLNGASTATGNKMEESFLLNDGLSATVGRKRYNLMPDVPYSKSEFANRIMFSNVNITDAFTNGYRMFQGLSYKDYDKQYGAITKLISLGQNIFVVMEHGLGLVPVNPKALMQTTTGETIHIYGYGVLPDEMTIISQDYGSKYEHSVIRTPIGIYGIDVDAKKIWRFSDKQGFETISDMKIETYLKDYLISQEIEMGESDIRTHYNGNKGDLMFTWYRNGEIYSICYNERQNIWVTRYDWTPIVSENINDEFYSLNIRNEDSDYSIWDHHYEVGKENNYISTWYDQEHGFEFEFIVSDPIGVNKIFENLQIISNNVSPKELQITIIGDDYTFKRDEITPSYEREEYPTNTTWTTSNIHKDKEYRELEDTVYKWDWRLHQKAIVKTQTLCDIYKHGRRLGNMQYKNGMWFIQIDPLRFDIEPLKQQKKEVRIRDKWAKIRIRYSGKDLAIITAIRTLINV